MKIFKMAIVTAALVVSTSANAALITVDVTSTIDSTYGQFVFQTDRVLEAGANYGFTFDELVSSEFHLYDPYYDRVIDFNGDVDSRVFHFAIQANADQSLTVLESPSWSLDFYNEGDGSTNGFTLGVSADHTGANYWYLDQTTWKIHEGDIIYAQTYDYRVNVAAVPIPAAVWLFGSGLLGLIGVARRKART